MKKRIFGVRINQQRFRPYSRGSKNIDITEYFKLEGFRSQEMSHNIYVSESVTVTSFI